MPEHPGFTLCRVGGRSIVRLRVRPEGADDAAAALGLPQEALRWQGEDPVACWLGPDLWLFVSDTKPAKDIADRIGRALEGQLHAATDLSSGLTCFNLAGPAVRTVLAMGCGIDMHPDVFTAGQCVRTNFAAVPLVIVAGDDAFDLYVDRSYTRYLRDWFAAAGEDPLIRSGGELQ
jgi:sarcosine oxidase subunit gamma